ncbi:MAG: MurR/RpiR family transcriptional regulator [Alicyclobacillus sp.]|nr:MurR/RpiR family transcriptional regulator [Alicyclobacillus sp.]
MAIPGGGLVRLRESLEGLSDSERRIAEFILQNPSEFVNMTIQEVAAHGGSSTAAVVRLWKTLQFAGFHDLKLRVAGDIPYNAGNDDYSELKLGSGYGSILQAIEETHVQSIQNTLRLLDEAAIQTSALRIVEAERVMAFGVGASCVVAEDIAQKLTRVGFPVYETSDFHKAAVFAAQLRKDDVLILVSHSGTTSDVLEIGQIAKRQGAHLIAVTRFGDTPLTRMCDTKLFESAVEPPRRVAATSSRIAALTVIDLLFVYLANQYHEQIHDALDVTLDVVKGHKFRN